MPLLAAVRSYPSKIVSATVLGFSGNMEKQEGEGRGGTMGETSLVPDELLTQFVLSCRPARSAWGAGLPKARRQA